MNSCVHIREHLIANVAQCDALLMAGVSRWRRRLSQELIQQQGMPLAAALDILRQHLPRSCVLVGQNISMDVQWLGLRDGHDFGSMMDLTGLYRIWNPKYKS